MRQILRYLFVVLTSGAVAVSCQRAERKSSEPMVQSLELANLDTTVRPCDDFFQYANGGWLRNNPVPASEAAWSSFHELYDRNLQTLRLIAEASAQDTTAAAGSSAQLVGAVFATAMDSAAAEQAGLAPLQAELARIEALATPADLAKAFARMSQLGVPSPMPFYINQDDRKSDEYAVFLNQGGLGLPTKDYYVKTGDRDRQIRADYEAYLGAMLQLLGKDPALAARVLALETRLANSSRFPAELREAEKNYNKIVLAELPKRAPGLDWNAWLSETGIAGKVQHLIVGQPEFFAALGKTMSEVPLADWKAYLQVHLVRSYGNYLNNAVFQTGFEFYGKKLSGQQAPRPRWKRSLANLENYLGEALAKEYVERTFSPEAKKRALEMVLNLQSTFAERINQLTWMGPETKQKALAKLQAIVNKIGYPDNWETYAGLQVDRRTYAGNMLRVREWHYRDELAKLGKPIDRTEWFMAASEVNAYYNPGMNEIVFPAGILQAPFFHPEADDAVNYGGMGAVIGHELTHGFDDQGRKYDAKGNLSGWWAPTDSVAFTQRANVVVNQYNGYKVADSVAVNGQLTLGENIADLGGLTIAYYAFQKTKQAKEGKPIDGLTPNQRFFLGWAQIWRTNIRPEAAREQVLSDPHSPAQFRVNGPVSNMPEFAAAFRCQQGAMVRPDSTRAVIW